MLNGFKKWLEDSQRGYLAALSDEEGIEWDDMKKAIENEPWVSSGFKLDDLVYKQSPWKVVKGSLTPTGGQIEIKPQSRSRVYINGGKKLLKSKYQDNKKYWIKRKDLEDNLTTGWQPAVQQTSSGPPPML